MSEQLAWGRRILAAQPFNRLLGAELTAFGDGFAELTLEVRPEFGQQHGFIHGGVISFLADDALTFAGGAVLGEAVLTSEYKLNYVRPASGERLIARASVIGRGRTQAVCRCDVFMIQGGQEKLCAAAQGTIVKVAEAPPGPA